MRHGTGREQTLGGGDGVLDTIFFYLLCSFVLRAELTLRTNCSFDEAENKIAGGLRLTWQIVKNYY